MSAFLYCRGERVCSPLYAGKCGICLLVSLIFFRYYMNMKKSFSIISIAILAASQICAVLLIMEPKNSWRFFNSEKSATIDSQDKKESLRQIIPEPEKTQEEIPEENKEDIDFGRLPLEEDNFKILLGTGKTSFAGSSKDRIANITIGSSKIDGIILQPGQEFSTLNTIGEVTTRLGYKPEANIRNGKTVMALGGGLCQVSTTTFRAALNSGMKITQRKNHAYAIGYYSPQGTDAAIANPDLDFKFINDTGSPVLIKAHIEKYQLIIEISSNKNQRQTKIKGPAILQKNPDGGMKTVLYQEVYEGEKLLRKSTFYSYYRPHEEFE